MTAPFAGLADLNPLRALRARYDRMVDYKAVFGSPEGRRVVADLARFCHYESPSFVPGSPDVTAFNEGLRRVFLRIKGFTGMDEAELERLMAEQAMAEKGERRDASVVSE